MSDHRLATIPIDLHHFAKKNDFFVIVMVANQQIEHGTPIHQLTTRWRLTEFTSALNQV